MTRNRYRTPAAVMERRWRLVQRWIEYGVYLGLFAVTLIASTVVLARFHDLLAHLAAALARVSAHWG